jgi:hypothetical protein
LIGIQPGDILEVTVEDCTLIAKPRKADSLEALRAIQRAFERSGITEQDLQEAGRRIRPRVASERYCGIKNCGTSLVSATALVEKL